MSLSTTTGENWIREIFRDNPTGVIGVMGHLGHMGTWGILEKLFSRLCDEWVKVGKCLTNVKNAREQVYKTVVILDNNDEEQ